VEDFPEAASAEEAAARSKDLVAVLPVRTFVVKYEYRQKQNGPCHNSTGRPGRLFGIDQEVVTLRGPFGKLRVPAQLLAGRINPNSPVV